MFFFTKIDLLFVTLVYPVPSPIMIYSIFGTVEWTMNYESWYSDCIDQLNDMVAVEIRRLEDELRDLEKQRQVYLDHHNDNK